MRRGVSVSVRKSLVAALAAGLWCTSSTPADAETICSAAIRAATWCPARSRPARACAPSEKLAWPSRVERKLQAPCCRPILHSRSRPLDAPPRAQTRRTGTARCLRSSSSAGSDALASVPSRASGPRKPAPSRAWSARSPPRRCAPTSSCSGARDALRIAEHLEQTFEGAASAARAAAESGLSAGIDADLAELSGVRLTQARLAAQQRFQAATALLGMLLGLNPVVATMQAEGELTPLPLVDALTPELARKGSAQRPELTAAAATRDAYEAWSDAYRRARVPNLTLSAFAQRDGFDERVLGGGLSIPIKLPASLARDSSGEAAENAALARRASALLSQTERELRLEVLAAAQALETARAEQALYTEARVARAEQSLAAIAREIAAGRLAVTSMSGPRAELIDFLNQHVKAKLSVCLASVELARAAGLPLTGGTP